MTAGLIDVASYLPPTEVGREYFERYARPDDPLVRNPMFRAPRSRRYADRTQTAPDLIELAVGALTARHGPTVLDDVEVLITHTALPDVPFLGAGAEIARRLGLRPESIIDLHNGHCAVFPYMLSLARNLLSGASTGRALLCLTQNSGRIFTQPGVRTSAHASVIGDGAAVALVGATGGATILDTEVRHHPEYAADVDIVLADGRLYWEPGTAELDVHFDNRKAQNIIERGTVLVPDVIRAVCDRLSLATKDIDVLVTNQPNRLLLRNWSRELGVDPARHPDTFDSYGNLFGAGMPITFDHAVRAGLVPDGSLVVFGGFAGAGELTAAAAVRWRENVQGGESE
ncbi:3-oxoacyl-ACP synthase III family protein [Actinophytocola gossypii]|uniref:3-oxoacyl-ACP synthase n=1 Tax=Actinophytocola gossypii TaxID=2812003 RepID=A0ABT2J5H2_9PSEU|nr:3-oxoacyl-[acyl-carrier-protein] synthase III C-terminal domain-containing protein [Actinophytocola gossypii]MCT2583118.1 3-oxoacyl-ACP synthase [Actinophytocola gossypii]